jgi:hypothetical protein
VVRARHLLGLLRNPDPRRFPHRTVTIAPRAGAEASFVRTDQWLGHPVPNQSPSDARAALVRRYLHLYGPSTVEDFAGWAGVAEQFARRAWSAVNDPLAEVDVAGRRCVVLAQTSRP